MVRYFGHYDICLEDASDLVYLFGPDVTMYLYTSHSQTDASFKHGRYLGKHQCQCLESILFIKLLNYVLCATLLNSKIFPL